MGVFLVELMDETPLTARVAIEILEHEVDILVCEEGLFVLAPFEIVVLPADFQRELLLFLHIHHLVAFFFSCWKGDLWFVLEVVVFEFVMGEETVVRIETVFRLFLLFLLV